MTWSTSNAPIVRSATPGSITLRALLLGQRLETRGLEHQDTIALMPLTLRVGQQGVAFVFRYGVVVFAGLCVPKTLSALIS